MPPERFEMDSSDKSFTILMITLLVVIFGTILGNSYLMKDMQLKCIALVADKSATEIMAVCK